MNFFRSTTIRYGVGYTVFTACRLLRDMMFAYLLGPEALGVWAALSIYRQYAAYSDVGLTNGLRRVLPKLLENHHDADARSTAGLAWTGAMVTTTLFAAVILAIAVLRSDATRPAFWSGIIALITMMYLDKHYMYLCVLFQSTRRVAESGIWMGALGATELVIGAVLTYQFGIYGLYASLCVSAIVVCGGMMWQRPFPSTLRFQPRLLSSLGVASLTLMGFGLVNVSAHNIDRVAILFKLGEGAELSHYHMAALIGIMVSQAPSVLLAVWVPEIFRFGCEDLLNLRRFFLLPSALIATLGACAGALLWLCSPWVFHTFLPAYWPATAVLSWLVLGEVFFATTTVAQNLEIAMDRGYQSLIVRVISIVGGLTGALWALSSGFGLAGVAASICVAHIASWLVVSAIASRRLGVPLERYWVATLVPILYALLCLTAIHTIFGTKFFTDWQVIPAACLFLVAFSPFFLLILVYIDKGRLVRLASLKRFLYWDAARPAADGVANQ